MIDRDRVRQVLSEHRPALGAQQKGLTVNAFMNPHDTPSTRSPAHLFPRLTAVIAGCMACAGLAPMASAQSGWDLFTVSDKNKLMRVNLSTGPTYSATGIGITRDAGGGPVRRIRGLAFAGSTLYGMTREGDLVTVNPNTGETVFKHSVATSGFQFWSDLTYDPVNDDLYTVNAFGDHALARIDLGTLTSSVQGPTEWVVSGANYQMLGVEFMSGMLVASSRQTNNVVEMDPADGSFDFTLGLITCGVSNLQQIAVHPGTGVLWGMHDGYTSSRQAVLSSFDSAFQATEMGRLPFGIVEDSPIGAGTYGWGGIAFVPVPAPASASILLTCGLLSPRRRR